MEEGCRMKSWGRRTLLWKGSSIRLDEPSSRALNYSSSARLTTRVVRARARLEFSKPNSNFSRVDAE
ncbi:hypothetical protein CCACVL1_05551 [Corchorus capsularis]|uniref:Uncharacterized protein n=1 Tax=Corchorus capsularis TaxID=210143 RepID=A0A1R3JK48_COCAP|nr:hypothetical protein CCACVL1_05551 [Corchorus capsularis]